MKRFVLLVVGFVLSLAVGAGFYLGASMLLVKLTHRPDTPLILSLPLLTIGVVIMANVLWQERFVPPRPKDLYSTSKYR